MSFFHFLSACLEVRLREQYLVIQPGLRKCCSAPFEVALESNISVQVQLKRVVRLSALRSLTSNVYRTISSEAAENCEAVKGLIAC